MIRTAWQWLRDACQRVLWRIEGDPFMFTVDTIAVHQAARDCASCERRVTSWITDLRTGKSYCVPCWAIENPR